MLLVFRMILISSVSLTIFPLLTLLLYHMLILIQKDDLVSAYQKTFGLIFLLFSVGAAVFAPLSQLFQG